MNASSADGKCRKKHDIEPDVVCDYQLTLGADNLSGGQRKLLALGRASLLNFRLLLLDESSVGIDGNMIQSHLLPALRSLKGVMTILIIDHNLNFVSAVADEIFLLADGTVTESGNCQQLLADCGSSFAKFHAEWNIIHQKK